MNDHKLLQDLGYARHLNKTASIFSESIDKVISYLGENSKNALISYISSLTKLPKNECFVYYDVTKNALNHVFGEKCAKEVLDLVKEEILIHNDSSSNESLDVLMNDLSKQEVLEFIRTFNGNEHVLYLYKDKEEKNKIMSEYFSSTKSLSGLLSLEPMKQKNVENILYENLLIDREEAKKKVFEFLSEVQLKNPEETVSHFFAEDGSLWLMNGLTKQYLDTEKSLVEYVEKNPISFICACNIAEISDDGVLSELIASHNYVILDEPFIAYRKYF